MVFSFDDLLGSGARRLLEEVIGVAGIGLAWLHALHLRKQVNRVEQVRNDLTFLRQDLYLLRSTMQEVRDSLPTKNLGEFPLYLDEIVELIRNAKRSITIFCDFPAYGCFSDPDNFLHYKHALEERANEEVTISIACLADGLREEKTREELSKDNWNSRKQDENTLNRIERLLIRHGRSHQPQDVTLDEMVQLLSLDDQAVLDHTFASAEKRPLNDRIPLYFWLVDDICAVFSIPSYHGRAVELGFFTQDPRLVQGLRVIHDRYFEEPHHHPD